MRHKLQIVAVTGQVALRTAHFRNRAGRGLVVLCLFVCAPVASAQTPLARPGSIAMVTTDAPIMLLPDATRQPLRIAARGTSLRIVQDGPEWLQVQFNDPDIGLRHGYIQAKYVQRDNELKPLDLSVPGAKPAVAAEPQRPVAQPVQAPTRQPLARNGYWWSGGAGIGSLTCDSCGGYANGFSGGVAFGGMLSPRVGLGGGSMLWYRSVDGVAVTAETVELRLRIYPSLYEGFFVTGGAGIGRVGLGVGNVTVSETGLGLMYGFGWDVRTGRNVSITPFWNGAAIMLSENVYFSQFGLGVTLH